MPAPAYAAATLAGVGAESQTVIGVLINSGAAWAAAARAAGVPEWKAAITGAPSTADRFAATAQAYLDAAEVEEGFADVVYANFGVYGEFAFVVVQLPDCKVLMDPLTGNLVGPCQLGHPLNAHELLTVHPEYDTASGLVHYSRMGCPQPMGIWVPGWLLPGPLPVLRPPGPPALPNPTFVLPPWGPTPIPMNPTLPGWDSPPFCAVNPVTGSCWCTVYRQTVRPGQLIWRRDDYVCPAGPCPPAAWAGCTVTTRYWW